MQDGPSQLPRRYTVAELQRILNIAPHFIDKSTKNIFVLTAGGALPILQEILQNETLWQSEDPISAIHQAIVQHNDSIPHFVQEKSKLTEALAHGIMSPRNGTSVVYKQIQSEIEALTPKLASISDYEWAVACKLAMQNADLLPETPEACIAVAELTEQLQRIHKVTNSDTYKEGAAFLRCDFSYLQEVFIQTLGKMCALGFVDSVKAIHQYMSFAPWVLSSSASNEVDNIKIAMTLAPGLFQALGIFGQIIPRTSDEMHNMRADTAEYALFKKVMMELITAPQFQETFDVSLYSRADQLLSTTSLSNTTDSRTQESSPQPSSSSSTRHTSLLNRFRHFGISSSSKAVEKKSTAPAQTSKSHDVLRSTSEPAVPLLPGYSLIRSVGSSPPASSPSSPRLSSSTSSTTTTSTTATTVDLSDSGSMKSKVGGNINLR